VKIRPRAAGAVLLAVLLLVDGILILRDRAVRGGTGEEVPVFDAPVSGLEIRVPGRPPAALEKRGGSWAAGLPPSPELSPELADFLAEDLASARPRRVTDENPADPAPFGLDPGTEVRIRFTADSGRSAEIRLGVNLPLDVLYVYAAVGGRTGVFRVPAAFRDRVLAGR
jgi:hypothetical protein